MSKQSENESEFVLKHRIVGAAFLLFFGAVLLPSLLGAPSEATKAPKVKANTSVQTTAGIEDELLAAIEQEEVAEEETVYISKITPLDTQRDGAKSANSKDITSPSTPSNTTMADRPKPDKQAEKQPAAKEKTPAKPSETTKKPTDSVVANDNATSSDKNNDESQRKESGNNEPNKTVEVGWVVQVGMFTDKRGAARVVEDLKSKGFSPSTTIVDTNLGKNTGTRVWLGPYAQRVEAAKTKNRLSSKTGVAGFIRAYP